MAQVITVPELYVKLKERLSLVHNLKKVYVGKMYVENSDNYVEHNLPFSEIPIAYGEPRVIADAKKTLVNLFAEEKSYTVEAHQQKEAVSNMLYVILDIDAKSNYCIDDLDDDILFSEPFSLTNKEEKQ